MPSILIVDDEKYMVEFLKDILIPFKYEIFTALSLKEMWEILEGTQIDLILLDILFPGENAFDHLDSLRKRFPSTGVVLISAKKDRDTILKALRSGVIDFIPKPPDPHEVEFVTKNALNRLKILKENERLTENLREKIQLLNLLLETSNQINSAMEKEIILKNVLTSVKTIFQCEGSTILTYDEKEDALIFYTTVGGDPKVKSVKLKKDQGIAGWCFTNKKPIIVDDLYSDPRFARIVDTRSGFTTKNIVAVPILKSDGTVIGVGELINIKNIKKFRQGGYLSALQSLSNLIAGALERAALIKEVVKVNLELDKMNMELEDKIIERTRELEKTIKELKATQSKLIETEKIAVIGELSAGIAHELNNALGYVTSNIFSMQEYLEEMGGSIKMIRQLTGEGACEKIKEVVNNEEIDFILSDIQNLISESNKGIEHTKKIISGLKKLSRTEKGSIEMISLSSILKDAIDFAHTKLKYVPEIKMNIPKLRPIFCYPNQLTQVFINLLNNAADAVTEKGEKGKIEITAWEDAKFQYVKISDNGIGISEEALSRIFDPFFTTKPPGKGTGLGLSISSRIIQDHYGEIGVESKKGEGTTFTIKLPKNLNEIEENKSSSPDRMK